MRLSLSKEKGTDFDPKPCPKRASDGTHEKTPGGGSDVSRLDASLTSSPTKSHRSELNRRPLLSGTPQFSGIWRLFNDITRRITAFQDREVGKSRPETVPKPCLFISGFGSPRTNLIRRIRFTPRSTFELEQTVRKELRDFAFRRHY